MLDPPQGSGLKPAVHREPPGRMSKVGLSILDSNTPVMVQIKESLAWIYSILDSTNPVLWILSVLQTPRKKKFRLFC